MTTFGEGKDVDLSQTVDPRWPKRDQELARTQNARAAGICRRLRRRDTPGVILGDDVGMGKTYVALGVVVDVFTRSPAARVLILTHSANMAKKWQERWKEVQNKSVSKSFKKKHQDNICIIHAERIRNADEFMRRASTKPTSHQVWIGTYDSLKKYVKKESDARWIAGLLRHVYRTHRVRLKYSEKTTLIRDVDKNWRGRKLPSPCACSAAAAHRILHECLDPATKSWRPKTRSALLGWLETQKAHSIAVKKPFDLLVVDEAHKLDGERRHGVITKLLKQRFEKGLWVTATPFSLSLEELQRRLLDFTNARSASTDYEARINALQFKEYADAVTSGSDFPELKKLQRELGRVFVRASWGKGSQRETKDWTREAQGEARVPSYLLERIIAEALAGGSRHHIASVRESLVSSWASAGEALGGKSWTNSARTSAWISAFNQVVKSRYKNDPKLNEVSSNLIKLVKQNQKVVVFTERIASSKVLLEKLNRNKVIRKIEQDNRRHSVMWSRRVPYISETLGLDEETARAVAKVIAHSVDRPTTRNREELTEWWSRHRNNILTEDSLRALAKRTRLPAVLRFDGEAGSTKDDSAEGSAQDKFNLPCTPLILIASKKAQEGIDLHHYCRRVVLYDSPWNPALIEQRIGRVQRLGSCRTGKEPIEIYYCFQKDSYGEYIAEKAEERAKMLHVLLGAGHWLNKEQEIGNLEKYEMQFPP